MNLKSIISSYIGKRNINFAIIKIKNSREIIELYIIPANLEKYGLDYSGNITLSRNGYEQEFEIRIAKNGKFTTNIELKNLETNENDTITIKENITKIINSNKPIIINVEEKYSELKIENNKEENNKYIDIAKEIIKEIEKDSINTSELRKKVIKEIHPDLTTDTEEKIKRENAMKYLNSRMDAIK